MQFRVIAVLVCSVASGLLSRPAQARVISRNAEISIGRETASAVEQYYEVDRDPVALARVRQIGRRLAAVAEDADYPFEFHVVESGEVNAFALPGGFVYVFRGLLQLSPNDDALAFVIAHEVSHVTRRHSIRQFEKNLLLSAGITAVLAGTGASGFGRVSNVVQAVASLSFTRNDEADADEYGIRILTKAGYNPMAAPEAMELVKRAAGDDKSTPTLLRSHPAPDKRIKMLSTRAAALLAERQTQRAAAPMPKAPVQTPRAALPGLGALEVEACPWQPLRPGARWVYRTSAPGGTESTTTVRVLEGLTGSSRGVYRVEYDLGRGVRSVRLLAPAGDRVLSRPDTEAASAAWRVEGLFAPDASVVEGERMLRFASTEKIQVPAGEFEAARVERVGSDGKLDLVLWYAKGVGLVKRLTPDTGAVQELLTYKLPME